MKGFEMNMGRIDIAHSCTDLFNEALVIMPAAVINSVILRSLTEGAPEYSAVFAVGGRRGPFLSACQKDQSPLTFFRNRSSCA